jgi:hypothetical protein
VHAFLKSPLLTCIAIILSYGFIETGLALVVVGFGPTGWKIYSFLFTALSTIGYVLNNLDVGDFEKDSHKGNILSDPQRKRSKIWGYPSTLRSVEDIISIHRSGELRRIFFHVSKISSPRDQRISLLTIFDGKNVDDVTRFRGTDEVEVGGGDGTRGRIVRFPRPTGCWTCDESGEWSTGRVGQKLFTRPVVVTRFPPVVLEDVGAFSFVGKVSIHQSGNGK